MSLFQTKLRPEDFVVTELLQSDPSGSGDFHYILFEKKGMTTFLLLDLLIKDFALNKNMIGIAGLKDKHAITRQWISISKRDVAKYIGGVNDLLGWLRKKGKVIHATYGPKLLKLGDNAGNHFTIKLVPSKTISSQQKEVIENFLQQIEKNGVPNYFGEQRFGYGGNNWKIGYELLAGTIRNIKGDKNTMVEKRFKIQAFASYVFNRYLDERIKRGLLYTDIPGDIRSRGDEIVTGPMPGDDLKYATGQAGQLEEDVFSAVGLTHDLMQRFKTYGLFGIRRNILLYPTAVKYTWTKTNDLILSFTLPSGSYATVVIDAIERVVGSDKKTIGINSSYETKHVIEKKSGLYEKKNYSSKNIVQKVRSLDDYEEPFSKAGHSKKNDKKAAPKDPTINPYTGQKYNPVKAKERAKKREKQIKEERKRAKKTNPHTEL